MKRLYGYLGIAAVLALPPLSSYASNWKRVGVTSGGVIVEVDVDSVGRLAVDLYTVMITADQGNQVVFLDCKGNYGNTGFVLSHIPAGSIVQGIERAACSHRPERGRKP